MNVMLWITAGLLALVALVGGITKAFVPKDKLAHHEGAPMDPRLSARPSSSRSACSSCWPPSA